MVTPVQQSHVLALQSSVLVEMCKFNCMFLSEVVASGGVTLKYIIHLTLYKKTKYSKSK